MARKRGNWIQRAIKHPGALQRSAQRAGALTRDGTIRVSWLKERAQHGDRRAALALTLRRLAQGSKRGSDALRWRIRKERAHDASN